MSENSDDDYYIFEIFGIKFELWYFILSINILLLIISYILFRIILFHGYQVSLDKTLNLIQSKSISGVLVESKTIKENKNSKQ